MAKGSCRRECMRITVPASKALALTGAAPESVPALGVVTITPRTAGRSPEASALLARVVGIRSAAWPGSQVLDAADFVATHHVFCRREATGALAAVGTYTVVDLADCRTEGAPFPLLRLVDEARSAGGAEAADEVADDVARAVADAERGGAPVAYAFAWALVPDVRHSPTSSLAHELLAALHCEDHDARPDRVVYATGEGRVADFYRRVGYRELVPRPLAVPREDGAGHESLSVFAYDGPTTWARECHARHRAAVDGRWTIV